MKQINDVMNNEINHSNNKHLKQIYFGKAKKQPSNSVLSLHALLMPLTWLIVLHSDTEEVSELNLVDVVADILVVVERTAVFCSVLGWIGWIGLSLISICFISLIGSVVLTI